MITTPSPIKIACAASNCTLAATIIHKSKPYCGKHALNLLESGEAPERSRDLRSARSTIAGQPNSSPSSFPVRAFEDDGPSL
jgi:hypothetical protein